MPIDLTTLTAPIVSGKESGSGSIKTIILVIAGFLLYKFFFNSNKKTLEEKEL